MGHSRGPAHRCPNPIAARLTEQATAQKPVLPLPALAGVLAVRGEPPAADDRFLARHAADRTIASATVRSSRAGALSAVARDRFRAVREGSVSAFALCDDDLRSRGRRRHWPTGMTGESASSAPGGRASRGCSGVRRTSATSSLTACGTWRTGRTAGREMAAPARKRGASRPSRMSRPTPRPTSAQRNSAKWPSSVTRTSSSAGRPASGRAPSSTLCSGSALADEGIGKPVTKHVQRYDVPGVPVTIFDTPGDRARAGEERRNSRVQEDHHGFAQGFSRRRNPRRLVLRGRRPGAHPGLRHRNRPGSRRRGARDSRSHAVHR